MLSDEVIQELANDLEGTAQSPEEALEKHFEGENYDWTDSD